MIYFKRLMFYIKLKLIGIFATCESQEMVLFDHLLWVRFLRVKAAGMGGARPCYTYPTGGGEFSHNAIRIPCGMALCV